jgi:methanogenic corrinoid protein MtbC1
MVMSQLYEHVFASPRNGRALVGTCVEGDLHEVGVRMVCDFFEMDGWDTYYLGANTPHGDVVGSVVDRAAEVLAVSATLAQHVRSVGELVRRVRAEPRTRSVTVLVGGDAFNHDQDLWRAVGADAHASDAECAISAADVYVAARP